MAIANVNNAPLNLNALQIHNMRLSSSALVDRVVKHYTQAAIGRLYNIVGSADFLGNPVGLFNSVSSGVADIFYEPYQGIISHGSNREIGIGFARVSSPPTPAKSFSNVPLAP